jgi:hemerythrin-like domain-containing protein
MQDGMGLLLARIDNADDHTALRLARALADGWRLRVIAHADAEEQDLFPVVLERFPAHRATVAALLRDHQLMRLLLDEAEREMDCEGRVTSSALGRFTALLHLQRLHSILEEQALLPKIPGVGQRTAGRGTGR